MADLVLDMAVDGGVPHYHFVPVYKDRLYTNIQSKRSYCLGAEWYRFSRLFV